MDRAPAGETRYNAPGFIMTDLDRKDGLPGPDSTGDLSPPGQDAGPLSSGQLLELERANARSRKVLGASRMAAFNGWTLVVCVLLCLPFALFDPTVLPIAACLGAVAAAEFHGRRLLLVHDIRGPRVLGLNQLVLLGLVLAYCAWQINRALAGPDPMTGLLASDPQLQDMLQTGAGADMKDMVESVGGLYRTVLIAVYATVMIVSLLFQGICALYYFSRGKLLREYLEQTPAWILEIQRRA